MAAVTILIPRIFLRQDLVPRNKRFRSRTLDRINVANVTEKVSFLRLEIIRPCSSGDPRGPSFREAGSKRSVDFRVVEHRVRFPFFRVLSTLVIPRFLSFPYLSHGRLWLEWKMKHNLGS